MTAYTKVYNVDGTGQVLNARTLALFRQVQTIYPLLGGTGHVRLVQGSYSTAIGASAGTHNGGGALDLMLSIDTKSNYLILQKAMRFCMFAAWFRETLYSNGKLVWGRHAHGIVIGDKSAAYLAQRQVSNYYAHDDGLASHNADNTWHPSVLFAAIYPLHSVNLARVVKEARKTNGRVPMIGVMRIQRALNKKLGTTLTVNGLYNAKTKAAYAHWEKIIGGNGDGIPGHRSLALLGAARFNVVT